MNLYGLLSRPLLLATLWLLVGANPRWINNQPSARQRLYFANHSSHLDAITLWMSLPASLRKHTRPVAAKDYWDKGLLRRYLAKKVLRAVLIERQVSREQRDTLAPLQQALQQGESLIIFPEGTRSSLPEPQPFKGGMHNLARSTPGLELIPVHLSNLHRSMPKGSWLPVPMGCTVSFGPPLTLIEGETKAAFLLRARNAVMELSR